MTTNDNKIYSLKKSINSRYDIIMLSNNSVSFPDYCSLQSFLSKPIGCYRYPSTITWHQAKRQRQAYGKKINNIKQLDNRRS